jgi:hypothetical protein
VISGGPSCSAGYGVQEDLNLARTGFLTAGHCGSKDRRGNAGAYRVGDVARDAFPPKGRDDDQHFDLGLVATVADARGTVDSQATTVTCFTDVLNH